METQIAKPAIIYLLLVPSGHNLLQVPKGKHHIPACSTILSIPSTAQQCYGSTFPLRAPEPNPFKTKWKLSADLNKQ